jgi:hypothetical protein
MPDADPPNDRRVVDPDLERLKRESESLHVQSEDIIERMRILNEKIRAKEEERRFRRENG